MPIYTYRCENCGVRFDHTAKFTDPQLTRCPECGKKSLKRVYQPVGIVFKGSGFYATDHKSPSGNKKFPGHEEPKASGESDTSAKTDTNKSDSKSSGGSDASSSGGGAAATPPAKPSGE